MKKFFAVVLACILCFSFAACKKQEKDYSKNFITGYKSGDVTLGQYTGITYKPLSTEVSDEEVDERLKQFLQSYKIKNERTDDDPVQKGDFVDIDYEGFKDGVAFDTGKGNMDALEIGSNTFIESFENALIGQKKGNISIDVTFPDTYKNQDLAGAKTVFNVNLKSVYYYTEPEVTDEFINEKTNGNYTTVDAFRENLRTQLKTAKEDDAEMQKEYDVVEKLIENTTYNIDMEAEISRGVESLKSYYDSLIMNQYGMDAKGYYSTLGVKDDQYEAMIKAEAELSVRYEFARSAIAEAERFEVTDKEIEDLGRKQMYSFGYTDLDEFYKKIEELNGVDGKTYITELLMLNKASDLVFETAVAEE